MKPPKGTKGMAFLLVGLLKGMLVCFCTFILSSCANTSDVRSEQKGLSRSQRNQRETQLREKKANSAASIEEKKRPVRAPTMLNSMEQVVKEYRPVLDKLGVSPGSDEFSLVEERLPYLKQNLAQILNVSAAKLTFLTNSETQSAWFADVVVVASKEGDAYFVDKEGKWFGAKLKDRVLGGVYSDEEGRKRFLSVFYGAISGTDFYRAYLGTTKLRVLSFNLDRQNDGAISGKIRLPDGKTILVSRSGRDNTKITVNDRPLVPLFQ